MNQTEILSAAAALTRFKEVQHQARNNSINPEILAMWEIYPFSTGHSANFLGKMIAFDIKHLQADRIRQEDATTWLRIRSGVSEYLPQVPDQIHPLPRGWKTIFRNVMRLYGEPHGK